MNHNQNTNKLQEKIISNNVKNKHSSYWINILEKNKLTSNIDKYTSNNRNRIYTQKQTLGMFLSQALNKDSSCQKVVNENSLKLKLHKISCSIKTGAYCKARKRLDDLMISNMCQDLAIKSETKVNLRWKYKKKNIYLIDGTTLTMPDTISNQEKYPQSKVQKQGLGFPICRMVAIVSLYTGCIVNADISSYTGKGASEQTLLRNMLSTFKKGDLLLADAFYSTYSLINYLIEHEINFIFVQNGARSQTTNFNSGEYLGKNDHIITIKKHFKPEWMDKKTYQNSPKELNIREVKIGGKILITNMLCPKETPAKEIQQLYKNRWQIEVDFRNIKSTLGLKSFTCKTPQMIKKEMWIYFLAYNLIRSIMLDSAIYNKIYPRQISFKHTLQLMQSYKYLQYKIIHYSKLLFLISKNIIGNRQGRIEPRALKKRPSKMPLLMKRRNEAREEIRKFGHPKKA